MTRTQLILLATVGSVALLGGAFIFQLLGYAPCQMCLWQRWPHAAAIVLGLLALMVKGQQRLLAALGAVAVAITAGVGIWHTGVEKGLLDGPQSCSGGSTLDGVDLLSTDIEPIVMCSDVVWSLFGLSMASYNAIASLLLAALWIMAATRRGA